MRFKITDWFFLLPKKDFLILVENILGEIKKQFFSRDPNWQNRFLHNFMEFNKNNFTSIVSQKILLCILCVRSFIKMSTSKSITSRLSITRALARHLSKIYIFNFIKNRHIKVFFSSWTILNSNFISLSNYHAMYFHSHIFLLLNIHSRKEENINELMQCVHEDDNVLKNDFHDRLSTLSHFFPSMNINTVTKTSLNFWLVLQILIWLRKCIGYKMLLVFIYF